MYKNIQYKIMCLCNGLVFFAPVAILLRTSKGITLAEFFTLQALLSIAIFVFEVPTGFLTDKIGYKNGILLAQILLLLARGIFLIADNFFVFAVEATIEAVSSCFMSGTSEAYLYEICKADKGEEDGFLEESAKAAAWGNVGFIVSTISYVFLYRTAGLNGLVIATEIATIISIIFVILMPEEPKSIRKEKKEKIKIEKKDAALVFGLLKFLILDAMICLAGLVVNFLYAEKLEWAGIPVEWMMPIILGYSALELLIPKVIKYVVEKKEKIIYIIFSINGAGLFFLLFLFDNWISVGCMIIVPFFLGIVEMIQFKYENQYIDQVGLDDNRATLLSIMNMGNNFLEIIFLIMSAIISTHKRNVMFLFVGILMIIVAIGGRTVLFRKQADRE